MKRLKTFIVGAGASAEIGFPTGKQLVEAIELIASFKIDSFGRLESGDRILFQAFSRLTDPSSGQSWRPEGVAQLASKIRDNMGLAPSIDYFLDSKKGEIGWVEVGKLLIARCILKAERGSSLYFDRHSSRIAPGFAELPPNWMTEIFKVLASQRGLEGFRVALKTCRFITFNYDRSIEQFFHQAIKSYFQLDDRTADSICSEDLQVFHVYGGLGQVSCVNPVGFGNADEPSYLVSASRRIKTFTEIIEDDTGLDRAKRWIESSQVVSFLGFGFLPLNLSAIFKGTEFREQTRVLGTAYGIPDENLSIAKNILCSLWSGTNPSWFRFESVKCAQLMWNHAYYLSELDNPP